MSKNKRYVPIAEYSRQTGLSYPTIKNAIETGQLKAIQTEAGHFKIDTAADTNPEINAIMSQLQGIEKAVSAICKQFNVNVEGVRNQ